MATGSLVLLVGGCWGDVGEEFFEGTEGDAMSGGGVDVVEELVEGLLGVPVCTFGVGVVAAPADILPTHSSGDRNRGAVVLEGGIHVFVEVFGGESGQFGSHDYGVLAVGLVEPVSNEWPPGGAALGNNDT